MLIGAPSHLRDEAHRPALYAYVLLLRLKHYPEFTFASCQSRCILLLNIFPRCKPSAICPEEIMDFLSVRHQPPRWNAVVQNHLLTSIKFFYKKVQIRFRHIYELHKAQKGKHLFPAFAGKRIQSISEADRNLEYKTPLCHACAGGLRNRKVIHLRVPDVDSQGIVTTKCQDGLKERQLKPSKKLRIMPGDCYQNSRQQLRMDEVRYGGHYDKRSISKKGTQQCKCSPGLKMRGSHPALHHSVANHLHESGTNIRYIQELPGHNNPNTTMTYTHVSAKKISEIKSPFDDFQI
jgi:integrase/recombinase XerD